MKSTGQMSKEADLSQILASASDASSEGATDQQRASCAFLRAFPGIRRVLLLMGELREPALEALSDPTDGSLSKVVKFNTNHK